MFFIFLRFFVKKEKKIDLKKHFLNYENQMQVIPLARNPREKKEKRKKTRKKTKQKKRKNTCHRVAICTQSPLCNSCLENCSQKSCLWFMSFSHVYGSCWTVWNGFAIFFVGVSTQSPLPSSCLEYGGLQCSHIFIIRCVFYCFHSRFISFPGAF